MKFILITLTIFASIFLWLSCNNAKYAADKLPEKQIRWGTGGGIVGKESAHILCDNGQMFNRDIVGTTSKAGKTKAKKAKLLYKTIETLDLGKMEFNHPANIYNFIEFQDGDMVSRVVWGDKNAPVGKPVEELFAQLNDLLKK